METPPTRFGLSAEGWRRGRAIGKTVLYLVLGGLVAQVAVAHRDELTGAGTYLAHVRWSWVLVAGAAEVVSFLSFTALQRRLLQAGGLPIAFPPLVWITLAGNAMANSLPGGGAFASVFAYRQFRRRGADEALATWTLLAVTGLTAVTLAVLAGVGLALAGDEGPVKGLFPFIVLLLVGPILGVAVLLRPRLLERLLLGPLRLVQRVARRPRRPVEQVVSRAVARLEAVTPGVHDWLVSLAFAGGNWVADCTCLMVAFHAVHAPVPVRALLLAYGAAQVAANLPITPGGLGVVEGSLTVALVAFGGNTTATVAAVLLYRILSFWALLPVGWTAWAGITWRARRADRAEAIAAVPVPVEVHA